MRGRLAALVAATVPLSALLTIVGCVAGVVLFHLVTGVGILASVALGPFMWVAARVVWRRSRPDAAEGAPAPALQDLVAEEAAAHGLPAPAVRIDAGRDVRTVAGAVVIGVCALAERSPEVLRAGIGEALLRDADPAGRRMVRLYHGVVTRALSVSEDFPRLSWPWAAHARLAQRLIHAALRERALAIDAALAARHGTAAMERHIRALAREDAFDWYWSAWVVPCLRAGFHPPVADGWRRWLVTPIPSAFRRTISGACGA